MFRWYELSDICFAYLSDADDRDPESFGRSRWFTRGWTLQELIAPGRVQFYDKAWRRLGTKESRIEELATLTHIDKEVLRNPSSVWNAPVARRMSWAAKRETSREEDIAYCLLGIFRINMPLLYGEGMRAFRRLQEAIATEISDLSLFAWVEKGLTTRLLCTGILADSPERFSGCSHVRRLNSPFDSRYEVSVTNLGLRINADLKPIPVTEVLDKDQSALWRSLKIVTCHLLLLDCTELSARTGGIHKWLAVPLIKANNTFVRVIATQLHLISPSAYHQMTSETYDRKAPPPPSGPIYVETKVGFRDQLQLFVSMLGRTTVHFVDGKRQTEIWPPRHLCGVGPWLDFDQSDDRTLVFGGHATRDYTGVISFTIPRRTPSENPTTADDFACALVFGIQGYEKPDCWAAFYAEARSNVEQDHILNTVLRLTPDGCDGEYTTYTEEDAHRVKRLIWSAQNEDSSRLIQEVLPLSQTLGNKIMGESISIRVEPQRSV